MDFEAISEAAKVIGKAGGPTPNTLTVGPLLAHRAIVVLAEANQMKPGNPNGLELRVNSHITDQRWFLTHETDLE